MSWVSSPRSPPASPLRAPIFLRPIYTRPWAEKQPSTALLTEYMVSLCVFCILVTIAFRSLSHPREFVQCCGVNAKRVASALREIERKYFHLCGLLIPLSHGLLLSHGVSNAECVALCWSLTAVAWGSDVARLTLPLVERNWPIQHILHEKEQRQLLGTSYLSLGCTLTIALSPPSIAMVSVLFLVLGDLSAAIIGVSFGKETGEGGGAGEGE